MQVTSDRYSQLRIYQNVVVTTANLKVCEVEVSDIDVTTGEIDAGSKFVDVPYVRFRKQLHVAADSPPQPNSNMAELRDLAKHRESTVFVVNSSFFLEFLRACELSEGLERCIGAR